SNTFNTLNNADMKFPTIKDENGEDIEITHGRFGKLLESNDPRVRREAFLGVYSVYEGLKNTLASTLNGQVKKSNFYASTRGYTSAREAALSGNHIPETVYDSLLKSVNANADLLHRYVKLRKE
ncbi:M3 family metallopeptidase, partial [Campylobacter lari]